MSAPDRKKGEEFSSLRMEKVSRWYGDVPALRDLDLELGRGDFVALLGPSGCGKSTALSCLAGLQPLTEGAIWRDDERLDQLPPERRGFGMVFQNYALFPHLTVQRNVEFGLAMRKVPRAERRERADRALSTVQLEEHGGKRPGQLSGGQQQRVAIARALAIEPEVVLMDEPLSNLDAGLRVELRTEIKRLHQTLGLSILYVTHDQEEALSLATKVVVLRDGCVEQIGTPEEVYTSPANPYVARFMGYRNILPGKATAGAEPGSRVTVAAVGVPVEGIVASAAPVGADADVTVAFRPDDVQVVDASAGPAGAGDIDAVVDVVEYHGRDSQLEVRAGDGLELRLRCEQRRQRGDKVTLRVPVDRVLVYQGSDGSAADIDIARPGPERAGRAR
ncbi:MAG: ABC transporter ATP-binding protein [Mycobacteriales bacterium]